MAVHPNSLANLDRGVQFTPETAPKGRKNLGLSVNEWRNEMADWPRERLSQIVTEPKAKVAQIMAAQELLKAIDGNLAAIAQACDYSNHRPLTKSDVTHHDAEPRTEPERAAARDSVLARIRGRLKRAP
jgi:hypothetical protein